MRAGGERICFNPELLSGTNGGAFEYQANVDELTNGSLPSAEEPCVPAENLPASFRLSGLDPENPDDVLDYVTHPIYHQTAVCIDQAARRWRENWGLGSGDTTPRLLDQKWWLSTPLRILKSLEPISDEAMVTTSALALTTLPQNDQTISAILSWFGNNERTCSEFTLIGATAMTSNPQLKERITQQLFKQTSHDYWLSNANNKPTPEEEELQRERSASLLPIYKDFYETGSRTWQERRQAIEAIVALRDEGALEYVTQKVFEKKSDALEALLQKRLVQPEVLPYLAKILSAPESAGVEFEKKEILKQINARTPPNDALLQAVALNLQRGKGIIADVNEGPLLAYMTQSGYKAVYYLRAFLEIGAIQHTEWFREGAAKAWASIDDPRAQNELVSCVAEKCWLAAIPRGSLRDEALEGMVDWDTPASREKLFKLLGEEFDPLNDEMKRLLASNIGHYGSGSWQKDPDVAFRFFTALGKLRDKAKDNDLLKRTIDQAQVSLAERYHRSAYWIQNAGRLDETSRFQMTTTWWGEDTESGEKALQELPLAPGAKRRLEKWVEENVEEMIRKRSPAGIFASPAYSQSLKERLLEKIAATTGASHSLLTIVDSDKVSQAFRKMALTRYALLKGDGELESFLLNQYIRNSFKPEWLREEAVHALKLRAEKLPERRQAVLSTLQSIVPVPPAVQRRAADALQSLSQN